MNMYFDKPNLVSFISCANKDKRYRYCMDTLMIHGRIFMNFEKAALQEDTEENQLVKEWMKVCSEGAENEPWVWGYVFPPRPIKSNTPKPFTMEQHSAVYLISDDRINTWKSKNQYLIASEGEEINVLSQLWMDDRQYTKNIFPELDEWSALSSYTSPCSDIIIIDQFLLLDENMLEYNLYRLLEILCKDAHDARMNIVLFSRNKDDHGIEPNWQEIAETIRNRIESISSVKPYVTIATGSKDKLAEHDRTIFTNYLLFDSGDSFNYFNSLGEKITRGRYFHVNSLACKNNMETARKFLNDMQKLYDSIKQSNPDNIHKEARCECNYIEL